MDYKELLKRNINEFINQNIYWSGGRSFISFLEHKQYEDETITNLIIELLSSNDLILKNEESLMKLACFAVANNYPSLLEMLIKKYNVNPTYSDGYFLRCSVENGFSKIVEVLLSDPRVKQDRWYNYNVKIAAKYKFTEILKLLLSKWDVKLSNEEKNKILSVYSENAEIVQLLSSK